jgi:hypothetical protein
LKKNIEQEGFHLNDLSAQINLKSIRLVSIQPKPENGLREKPCFAQIQFLSSVSIQPKPENGLRATPILMRLKQQKMVSIQPKPENGLRDYYKFTLFRRIGKFQSSRSQRMV